MSFHYIRNLDSRRYSSPLIVAFPNLSICFFTKEAVYVPYNFIQKKKQKQVFIVYSSKKKKIVPILYSKKKRFVFKKIKSIKNKERISGLFKLKQAVPILCNLPRVMASRQKEANGNQSHLQCRNPAIKLNN